MSQAAHQRPRKSDAQVRQAIETVKQHLTTEYIVEECKDERAFGCASCHAIHMRSQLDDLLAWLEEK